jgi:tetraacyldisaccharide 4'-kinase
VKHWYRRGPIAWLLWPASLAFRMLVFSRRILFRLRILTSEHPGVPVIVVGNLTAGGSGKTPLVIWVAQFLSAKGWSPAIVSRGYGGSAQTPCAATIASKASEVGDEPIVLSRRSGCPVWVGGDRARVIQALRSNHPEVDVIVLDDGLQHYRLRRDLEIAVVDSRGFGNGFMIPAGPLREPPGRLKSVDAVVANGFTGKQDAFKMTLEGEILHRMTDANDRRPAAAFKGETVHAVAGIGNPNRFFLHLRVLGMRAMPHPFPDHHAFAPSELEFGDAAPVVMTEKDAVKLRHQPKANWWVLPVTARLDPAFGDWLERELRLKVRNSAGK